MVMIHSKRPICLLQWLCLALVASPLLAQTDETIYREFQFDFSTPGARANAMGRAFVGLADEATAAYSNPAGLSVLQSPEFSFEYRFNQAEYQGISPSADFDILQDPPEDDSFDLDRIGFASFAFSRGHFNFSAYYVSNLDYRREPIDDRIIFEPTDNPIGWSATYNNAFEVHGIRMDTMGLSISRNFGMLDLGVGIGLGQLNVDFNYTTSLNNDFLIISDLIDSTTRHETQKMVYVFGALYKVHPRLKLGLSYKRQPRFVYSQHVFNNALPEGADIPVTFKVPDSLQLGLAWQPNDLWTILLDVDWIRYDQLAGDNFTQLSARVPLFLVTTQEPIYRFDNDDFQIQSDPEIRLGAEYLLPLKQNIIALRAGGFLDPYHKMRFVGTPPEAAEGAPPVVEASLQALYSMQDFIYNTDDEENNVGVTAGLGFVWHNKTQFDVAYVHSDRYKRLVCSFLYRF